jgi:hypothetical protein
VLFLGLCAPFPLWWMQQNEKATGDALYPIHFIEEYHQRWVQDGVAWLGNIGQRLFALLFFPGTLVATTSALVGFLAAAGLWRAFAKKERRALALLALVPVAYYTFRGAVLLNFSPLARFFMTQVALSLFFVKDGFDWLFGGWSLRAQRAVAVAAGAIAVGTTVFIGQATAFKSGKVADSLRPVSPISTIPLDQRAAADFLKHHVGSSEALVVDEAPRYLDINVAFFSGLPEARLMRKRWSNFEKHLAEGPRTQWMLAAQGGTLQTGEGVPVGEDPIAWRGRTFRRVLTPSPTLFVYRAE